MTIEEAKEQLQEIILDTESLIVGDAAKGIYRKDLEALKMAVEVLEKQIPKKPNGTRCPICKRALRKAKIENGYTGRVKTRNADDYCPKCGQALDWSETDD